jgi:hypothetical protein
MSGADDALGWTMMGVGNAVASPTALRKSRNVRQGTTTRRPSPSRGKGGAGESEQVDGFHQRRPAAQGGMCGKALLATGL